MSQDVWKPQLNVIASDAESHGRVQDYHLYTGIRHLDRRTCPQTCLRVSQRGQVTAVHRLCPAGGAHPRPPLPH